MLIQLVFEWNILENTPYSAKKMLEIAIFSISSINIYIFKSNDYHIKMLEC